jgi:hypothetical protein
MIPIGETEHLLESMLDLHYEIEPGKLGERGWGAIPFASFISPLEAEWLETALINRGVTRCRTLSFEFASATHVSQIDVTQDAILDAWLRHSHEYLVLYDPALSFLVFKDQNNRYFLVCGDQSFLSGARPYRPSTHRRLFLDWASEQGTREERYLRRIWEKYAAPEEML